MKFSDTLNQLLQGDRLSHLSDRRLFKGRLRLSAFDQRWVFDGEFADLVEGFGLWLPVLTWVKSEFDADEE